MTTSTEVPGRFPVAIDGRPYMVDPAGYQRQSVPVLREQADQSNEPGEQSLNPRGLWRRAQDSWHHGAGQNFQDGRLDGTPADPERFRGSSYVNVWERGEISLLPGVTKVRDGGRGVIAAGNHAYCYDPDDDEVYWFSNPVSTGDTWSAANIQAGQGAQNVNSITTDGRYVWAALGSSGLHRTVRGTTSSTADVPAQACTLVGYALGRLLIANGNTLYEVTSPISSPTANLLFTHEDTDFEFRFIRPGRNCIYVGGNVDTGSAWNLNTDIVIGGNAEIYRINLEATDGSLGAPIMATYLPEGEQVYDCRFYAGGIIIATSRGLRVGIADAQGNIDYGPLFAEEATGTGYPIHALEPQDRYVWFSWHPQTATMGLGTDPGLGRADLGLFVDTLTPAYAADVLADPGNDLPLVDSATTLANGKLLFSMYDGGQTINGVFRRHNSSEDRADEGILVTGQIRLGTTETKRFVALDVHYEIPNDEVITVERSIDGGDSWTTVGTLDSAETYESLTLGPVSAETIMFRFTLTNGVTSPELGPTIFRWTLRALPTPTRTETFVLPLILHDYVQTNSGEKVRVDIPAEINALKTLERAGSIVEFQVGSDTFTGYIENSSFTGEWFAHMGDGAAEERNIAGIYTLQMTTVT